MSIRDGTDIQEREVKPRDGAVVELLIVCQEDRTLPAVLVGMLKEADRLQRGPEARTDSARESSGRSKMTWRTRKTQVGCRPFEDSGGS